MVASVMDVSDPRAALDRLIRERGEDYASLSRLLGRNAAYIQQFIKRGIPRKLDEEDRRALARYFGVPQSLLGGPPEAAASVQPPPPTLPPEIVRLPLLDIRASAGPGAFVENEQPPDYLSVDVSVLRKIGRSGPDGLAVIQVSGDSMEPTLHDGDDLVIDRLDAAGRLRDGIYVLRLGEMLMVKRIAMHPAGRGFEVRSDNPAYTAWRDCGLEDLSVIGRVVWRSHRIR